MKRYLLISMWRVRPVLLTVIFGTLVFGGNPIPDGQQALYAKYSPLTKEALVSALNDQDSSVRVLAASMLSDEKFIDAAPFILTALGNEPVAGSRVNLAFAAARLGSEDGLKYLQRECGGNPDKEPAIRMLAAQVMIYLQRQECLGSVLEILRAQEDVQITQQALNLLPNFANIPSDKRAEIRSLASWGPDLKIRGYGPVRHGIVWLGKFLSPFSLRARLYAFDGLRFRALWTSQEFRTYDIASAVRTTPFGFTIRRFDTERGSDWPLMQDEYRQTPDGIEKSGSVQVPLGAY